MTYNLVFTTFVAVALVFLQFVAAEDAHENCKMWAEAGECEKNPGYMLKNCKISCAAFNEERRDTEVEAISSFFDLTANDIFGEPVEFKKFKDQVTIVVNVGR